MNYCPKCGENVEGQNFCTKCGTKLTYQTIAKEMEKEEIKKNGNGKVLMLVDIGLLALFAAICCLTSLKDYVAYQITEVLSDLLVPIATGIYVVTIIGRIKYRKNLFFLITLIMIIIATVAYLFVLIVIFFACASCIAGLQGMGMVLG